MDKGPILVTIRKHGDSSELVLPNQLHVLSGCRYYLHQSEDGIIQLKPQIKG